ncbi:hypothetical protein BC827DRAFT_1219389 [Russula dissimulans]|nr:hypothetical protein BC827DRAFT_1219389 [Russula dissimulans]
MFVLSSVSHHLFLSTLDSHPSPQKTTARRRTPTSPKPLTRPFDRTNIQASPGPTLSEPQTRGRRPPWDVPLALGDL